MGRRAGLQLLLALTPVQLGSGDEPWRGGDGQRQVQNCGTVFPDAERWLRNRSELLPVLWRGGALQSTQEEGAGGQQHSQPQVKVEGGTQGSAAVLCGCLRTRSHQERCSWRSLTASPASCSEPGEWLRPASHWVSVLRAARLFSVVNAQPPECWAGQGADSVGHLVRGQQFGRPPEACGSQTGSGLLNSAPQHRPCSTQGASGRRCLQLLSQGRGRRLSPSLGSLPGSKH